jgi:hypothetical protein
MASQTKIECRKTVITLIYVQIGKDAFIEWLKPKENRYNERV